MMIFIVWGKLKNSAIMVNKDALLEYERLKQKFFFTIKKKEMLFQVIRLKFLFII